MGKINYKNDLIVSLQNKESNIGIIGLGYVGLPLALTYTQNNYKVIGFDIDIIKVKSINKGKSYILHVSDKKLDEMRIKGLLEATTDFKRLNEVDAIIICVPTPLNKYREPDLRFIRATLTSICKYLRPGIIISLESTTYPGTTEEEIKPAIEKLGMEIGEDIFLVYSPEREDPGNVKFKTTNIPKIIGGITRNCNDVGYALYENVISEVIPVSNTRTAEMTKLLENIHRAVNIGLMNELKPLAEAMNIDIYEVIRAAATKPFGFVPYYPGPGLGGHCIPIDPFYLTWKAREFDMNTRFIELAGEINTQMPYYVVEKTNEGLNKINKSLNGSKILVLGIAYKKNIDDIRESPAVKMIKILLKKGGLIDYSDPYFPVFPEMRNYQFDMQSIILTPESIKNFDAVILVTDHDLFDYSMIKENSKLLVDTRGKFTPSDTIIRA